MKQPLVVEQVGPSQMAPPAPPKEKSYELFPFNQKGLDAILSLFPQVGLVKLKGSQVSFGTFFTANRIGLFPAAARE